MSLRVSRRTALQSMVASSVGFSILPAGSARTYAANEKLNIALVGCGGRGSWFVQAIPQIGENLVAMCDVNRDRAAESFKRLPDVPKYDDYRKMLEEKDKEIDAVIVAAPDHIHAPCGIMAMRMGKHLLCEKPLTNTIEEARRMREVARETGVVTQMGNQGTASDAFREQVEVVRSGALGEIQQVLVWNADGGGSLPIPTETMPEPEYLSWNLWLGPREFRTYHRDWIRWRAWREFGTAQLGNWSVHSTNMQFMAFRVFDLWHDETLTLEQRTIRVRSKVSERNRIGFPQWEIIYYDIPARGTLPAYTVQWLNGLKAPGFRETIEPPLGHRLVAGGSEPWIEHAGCLVVGSNGTIHSNGHNVTYALMPETRFADYVKPEPSLPRSPGHEKEWLNAIRGGPAPMSNFDYASALSEFVLLGNVATQFDRAIHYDPVGMKCIGDEEADAALRLTYRKGWEIA